MLPKFPPSALPTSAHAEIVLNRLPTTVDPTTLPAELTVRFHSRAFAELACALRNVERREDKVVALRNDDPLQLYKTFIATVLLSRGVSE